MAALEIIIAQEAILDCASNNTLHKRNHDLILPILLYPNLSSLSMVSLSDVGFFVLFFFGFFFPLVLKFMN